MDDNLESGWNLWVWLVGVVSRRWVWPVGGIYGYGYNVYVYGWLVGVVIRRYIYRYPHIIIIINFPYSTCIRSFFGSSILTSLFIFKMFFSVFKNKNKNKNKNKKPKWRFLTSRGAHVNCAIIYTLML